MANSFVSISNHIHQSLCVVDNKECLLSIRNATINDINELGDILTQSFHNPIGITLYLYPVIKLGICKDLRTRFRSSNPNYISLVAIKSSNQSSKKQEKIVGTVEISLRHIWGTNLGKKHPYISNLAVNPSFRRQGIASELLLKCEQIAYSWGYDTINLHVLENNNQAQQLYLENGYQIKQIESSFWNWFRRKPRRLFLQKSL